MLQRVWGWVALGLMIWPLSMLRAENPRVGADGDQPDENQADGERSDSPQAKAADAINAALSAARGESELEQQLAILDAVSQRLLQEFPENALIRRGLEPVSELEGEPRLKALRGALREARTVLEFRVYEEAPLPKGFPAPTPLGEVQVKEYPEYRLARAESDSERVFSTLFRHISERKIEMTAPVEMRFQAAKGADLKQQDMAFLYRSTEQGKLEDDGTVEVIDVPALTTVSVGLRDSDARRSPEEWLDVLRDWLKRHPEYEEAGPVRLMGYNSPFVLATLRYQELELPIRKRNTNGNSQAERPASKPQVGV